MLWPSIKCVRPLLYQCHWRRGRGSKTIIKFGCWVNCDSCPYKRVEIRIYFSFKFGVCCENIYSFIFVFFFPNLVKVVSEIKLLIYIYIYILIGFLSSTRNHVGLWPWLLYFIMCLVSHGVWNSIWYYKIPFCIRFHIIMHIASCSMSGQVNFIPSSKHL